VLCTLWIKCRIHLFVSLDVYPVLILFTLSHSLSLTSSYEIHKHKHKQNVPLSSFLKSFSPFLSTFLPSPCTLNFVHISPHLCISPPTLLKRLSLSRLPPFAPPLSPSLNPSPSHRPDPLLCSRQVPRPPDRALRHPRRAEGSVRLPPGHPAHVRLLPGLQHRRLLQGHVRGRGALGGPTDDMLT
jgi:hypothetical protein